MKYIIFLALLACFSCSRENKKKANQTNKEKPSFFLNKYLSLNESDKRLNLNYLNKSFNLIISEKNTSQTRNLLSKIILEYYNNSDFNKLNESAGLLISLSSQANDSINIALGYRSKGNYYYKINRFDSCYYYYIKAEKIYLKTKDSINYSTIIMNKGIVQYSVGDYLGSELSLKKANTRAF